jgi:hypothetical protein
MPRNLFAAGACADMPERILQVLRSQGDFLTARTAGSPRATGDAVQEILSENFQQVLGDCCREYSTGFARRAMADLAFKDTNGFFYVVDVKTHRSDTKFNMPNLISVERLARFYEDDSNCFAVLLVAYSVVGTHVNFEAVTFAPIEWLDWPCLTLGALGWGQIQIANSNRILVNPRLTRKQWMLDLCDAVLEFYPREIAKIQDRIGRFHEVRSFWQAKLDNESMP